MLFMNEVRNYIYHSELETLNWLEAELFVGNIVIAFHQQRTAFPVTFGYAENIS